MSLVRQEDAAVLYPIADLRTYLAGTWEIRRILEDKIRGEGGRFDGQASFAPESDDTLAYREDGCLVLGGFATLAHQSYLYGFPAPLVVPHRAEVRFADGRPFHDLDLSAGLWQAEHLCAADLYRGQFRAEAPGRWSAVWTVTGPRKDQRLESLFTRAA